MSSLEVDLAGVEEGSTIVVKWRGKPVFIKNRSLDEIAAQAATPMSDLKDPQTDAERTVDPRVGAGLGWAGSAMRRMPACTRGGE
jgi:ubiquinol-cytochrome c reductase iron-sulfur subunit